MSNLKKDEKDPGLCGNERIEGSDCRAAAGDITGASGTYADGDPPENARGRSAYYCGRAAER